jgi:omega-amidase
MQTALKISGLQFDLSWENPRDNFNRVEKNLNKLEGVDLFLLPETFSTGFTMKSHQFAEEKEGASESFFSNIAQKLNIAVGGGWIEKRPNNHLPFNTFSIFSPTGKVVRYRKLHPFSFAGEDLHYSRGEDLVVLNYKGWNISPLICYDLRFPETFRKTAGLTDLYCIIANWPSVRIDHWLSLLKARAIENQAFVFGLNRIGSAGKSKKIFHNGYSSVIDPWGRKTVKGVEEESLITANLSIVELKEIRALNPYLKDIQGIDNMELINF